MTQPINITETAAAQIEKLLSKAPEGTQGVRLNVKPRGCSGNSYQMEYIKAGEDIAADEAFKQGPKVFRDYASKLWQKNILETWE